MLYQPPPLDPDAPDFVERYEHLLRTDPAFFAYEIWEYTGLSEKAPLTVIDADMIRFSLSLDSPDENGVLGPRGVGKTHLITCVGTCYDLYLDYTLNIIIRSKSGGEARKTVKLIKSWLNTVPFLQHLAPRAGQIDRENEFEAGPLESNIARQASVTALGIESQLPGNRAHRIYDDDIETDENSATEDARQTLRSKAIAVKAVRYVVGEDMKPTDVQWPRLRFVGTRWHEDSVYDHMGESGYKIRAYPLLYLTPEETTYCPHLAPCIAEQLEKGLAKPGEKVFRRYPDKRLESERAAGAIYFGRQFLMLKAVPGSDRPPFKLSDLIVIDEVPRFTAPIDVTWGTRAGTRDTTRTDIPMIGLTGDRLLGPAMVDESAKAGYTKTIGYLDPAGKGNDLSGLTLGLCLAGMWWVPVCRGVPGGVAPEQLDHVILLCRHWNIREFWYEGNNDDYNSVGDGLTAAVSRHALEEGQDPAYPKGWSMSINIDHATRAKEDRIIDTCGVPFGMHRVIMAASELRPDPAIEFYQNLQYQISRLRRIRKCLREDGAFDSLAGMIAKSKEALSRNAEDLKTKKIIQTRDQEIEQMRRLLGAKPKARPSAIRKR